MIYYTYRWLLAAILSLLLLCLGYFYFLSSSLHEMTLLKKEEKILNHDIKMLKSEKEIVPKSHSVKSPTIISKPKNQFELMTEMVKIFNNNHLNVRSIHPIPTTKLLSRSPDFIQLSLILQGKFQHFISFLNKNSQDLNSIPILDFYSQLMNGNTDYLKITLIITIFNKIKTTITKQAESQKENIFIDNNKTFFCPPQGFYSN